MNMNCLSRIARVEMLLRNVLYISYCLPSASLRPLVPACLPLRLVGEDRCFLSIVVMNCQNVHSAVLPFPRFNYNQLNLRTYVLNPVSGQPAVCFLKSGVTSRFISSLTSSIGIPWQPIQLDIRSTPDERDHFMEYRASGCWQSNFKIIAGRDLILSPDISPFEDITSAVNYLVRPLEGFFFSGRRLGHITIRHPEIMPRFGVLRYLDFPLLHITLNRKDLVIDKPHSVFFVENSRFFIFMPPRYLKT